MLNLAKRTVRASELPKAIPKASPIGHGVEMKIQLYVLALGIGGYQKSRVNISEYFGVTVAGLSRLLSHALLGDQLDIKLNRETRLLKASALSKGKSGSIEFIIDATVLERASRKAENTSIYHSDGKKINGNWITNVGILLDGDLKR